MTVLGGAIKPRLRRWRPGKISDDGWSVAQSGDHILAQSSLYGGTYTAVVKDFPGFGISHTLVSGQVLPRQLWHDAASCLST